MKKDESARKKYLAKIQKLMRLADNTSSPQEAASAISKAQAFMREHGITDTEVTFSDISTSSSKGTPSNAVNIPRYMSILAGTIEKAFGVNCIFTWRRTASLSRKRVVSFYGQDGRDIVAAYAFDVLTRQLRAARKKFMVKEAWRYKNPIMLADKFCEGWASGAWHAVSKMVISESQTQQMEAYNARMQENGVVEAKSRKAKNCSGQERAEWAGYSEGKNARIHHGVNSSHVDPSRLEYYPEGQAS